MNLLYHSQKGTDNRHCVRKAWYSSCLCAKELNTRPETSTAILPHWVTCSFIRLNKHSFTQYTPSLCLRGQRIKQSLQYKMWIILLLKRVSSKCDN